MPKVNLMKKVLTLILYALITLILIACGSKTEKQEESTDVVESVQVQKEITDENLKQSKQDLLQEIANDLYLEAEKELEAAPPVKMDESGIYDDIEAVDVIVDLPKDLPALDLGLEPKDESVGENKKE